MLACAYHVYDVYQNKVSKRQLTKGLKNKIGSEEKQDPIATTKYFISDSDISITLVTDALEENKLLKIDVHFLILNRYVYVPICSHSDNTHLYTYIYYRFVHIYSIYILLLCTRINL